MDEASVLGKDQRISGERQRERENSLSDLAMLFAEWACFVNPRVVDPIQLIGPGQALDLSTALELSAGLSSSVQSLIVEKQLSASKFSEICYYITIAKFYFSIIKFSSINRIVFF